MTALGGRDPSQHFGATVERTVRVNDAAMGYGKSARGEAMPPGSVVLQLHYAPASAVPIGAFVMAKQPTGWAPRTADWEYLVLDGELRVLARGALAPCARCHATAPHDSLFGPPR